MPSRKRPKPSVVSKAHALHAQIAVLNAEYEKLALEIKRAGPGVYGPEEARAIVSEYEQRRVDWAAVTKAAKVPPRLIAKHTRSKPVRRLDWAEDRS